jgi:hypothetical protein
MSTSQKQSIDSVAEIEEKNVIDNIKSIKKDKLNIGDFSIKQDDLFLVGDAEIEDKGLVNHHLTSADDLYTNGITQIITQVFKVDKDIDNKRDSTP